MQPDVLCSLLGRVEGSGLLEEVEMVVDEWLKSGPLAPSVLVSGLALLIGAREAKALADLLLKSDVNGLLELMESSCGRPQAVAALRGFLARIRVKVQGTLLRYAMPRLAVGLRAVVADDLGGMHLHLYATLMNDEHVHMILSESDIAKIVYAVAKSRPSLLKRVLERLGDDEIEDDDVDVGEVDALDRPGLADNKLGRIFQ